MEEVEAIAQRKRRSVSAVLQDAVERYVKDERARDRSQNGGKVTKKRSTTGTSRIRTRTGGDLWDTIAGPFRDLPKSVLKKLPRDGAVNHDRYIYGRS